MTRATHETIQDNLPAFALGSLSVDEAAFIEAHLADCDDCRITLQEYHEVMRLLPHALPIVAPSPSARDLLLARVQTGETAHRRRTGIPRGWTRLRALALTASLALLLVVGALIWTILDEQGSPEEQNPARLLSDLRDRPTVQMLAMTGSEHAPSAVGQIIVDPGDSKAALLVSGLPPLSEDREYQFWFVQPDSSRVSGGVFTVDSNGSAIVAIDAPAEFSRAWRCGVTEEPAGGSPTPTGRNVLAASYENPIEMEYAEPG